MGTQITRVDPPRRLSERGSGGRAGRIPSATEWELEEGPGSLTTLRVVHWTEPSHPLDRLKDGFGMASLWYRRDWEQALRRLRDMVEADDAPVEGIRVGGGNRQPTGIP
jgi:hypothetical protein